MRRGLFLKFLGLTLAFGLVLDAVILSLYYSYRHDQVVGEMSAEIGTLATRMARPLKATAADAALTRDLLGMFAGFPYMVCVDFYLSEDTVPSSWPLIGCEKMKPGLDLSIPAVAASPTARFDLRLDNEVLDGILRREFTILAAFAAAVTLAIVLAAALVFHRIINRPLHRLVAAMTRFEVDNVPEKVEWNTRDEIGLVTDRYNAMLDREVERVAEIDDSRKRLSELVERLQEARDNAEQALRELRKTQDRLVQTEKMASLGQLTAGIAHEIKNPLNFVNNFASLSRELLAELKEVIAPAIEKLADDERADADDLIGTLDQNLSKVNEHGSRADRIIRNMLLHSRQDSGSRNRSGINSLVEESLGLAYHGVRAEDKNFQATLDKALAEEAGEIEGYSQELTRVFVNLFVNGFYAVRKRQAEGEQGYRPTVTATTVGREGEVEIRIRDNGTGMPADVKKKLFTPFFTTKPPGEGTGLGLSISHDIIVKQHGGTISVESEPGSFTEFTIVLPRKAPRDANTQEAEA